MSTHRDIATSELNYSSALLTMNEGGRAAKHGLKAMQTSRSVFPSPAQAPVLANRQLSLQRCLEFCSDERLRAEIIAGAQAAEESLDLLFGDAWRPEYAAEGLV